MATTSAHAQVLSFKIPRKPAAEGVAALARQADIQVLITDTAALTRVTNPVSGNHTPEQALEILLAGTGLKARALGGQTWAIVAEAAVAAPPATARRPDPDTPVLLPELLIEGAHTLNTGIPRSADDSQPYVVFTASDIVQSGAMSLETFFRDRLGSDVSVGTAEQNGDTVRGLSAVNLRGLGAASTLVLVDGRRLAPGVNGSGLLIQPTLVGFSQASIERVEVLASSASGIYGANAAGGVVNIILRRDDHGLEVSTSWSDVVEGSAPEAHVDVNGGRTFNRGKTKVSISGSWSHRDALSRGSRDFGDRARALAALNIPGYWEGQTSPPLGATANILSATGAPLQLDAVFGGATLGSKFTSLPAGYRGVALDGVSGLVANAGRYNLALADNGLGARGTLTTGAHTLGGILTVRHELTPTLSVYGEMAASRAEEFTVSSRVASVVTLAADAPNNPFQQPILVAVPHTGADVRLPTQLRDRRLGVGAVLRLKGAWKASLDLSTTRARIWARDSFPLVDQMTQEALNDGSLDVMRDLVLNPLSYGYETGYGRIRLPSTSTAKEASLRLAGPLPVRMPGGRVRATILAQHIEQGLGDSYVADASSFVFTPWRAQTTDSLYGEVRVPVLGPENRVPFARDLEIQVAGRRDHYVGEGADALITCAAAKGTANLQASEACSRPGINLNRGRTVNSHFDPSYSLRWGVVNGVVLRGSWATGYLPPNLTQLVPAHFDVALVDVRDPLRGNERVGSALGGGYYILRGPDLIGGGNPDIDPQVTTSRSFGAILEPTWTPGLRVSIDWTRIVTRNAYYQPTALLIAGSSATGQAAFEAYLRRYPDRVVRGPASDGYAVGPITGINISTANFGRLSSDSLDATLTYSRPAFGGDVEVSATGTWLLKLGQQQFDGSPVIETQGVATSAFSSGLPVSGGLAFKGTAGLMWSNDRINVGWRARYFDSYYLRQDRAIVALAGSNKIRGQMYHDLFARLEVRERLFLDLGVNNVLNTRPPLDLTVNRSNSRLGDPRGAVYRAALTRRF